jgi:hypothetical protein
MLTPYSTLYEKLICILVDAWSRTEVSDRLREHLLIFKPGVGFSSPFFLSRLIYIFIQVFPEMLPWATYGINALQKQVYSQEMGNLLRGRKVSPYLLEFLAALERTEAYAHTGNAKVLSNAVMKPLFITRSLLEHGMPTINKAIYNTRFLDVSRFTIQEDLWPLSAGKKGPAICSKRSQMLTYGESHFMVSELSSAHRGPYRFDSRLHCLRLVVG